MMSDIFKVVAEEDGFTTIYRANSRLLIQYTVDFRRQVIKGIVALLIGWLIFLRWRWQDEICST